MLKVIGGSSTQSPSSHQSTVVCDGDTFPYELRQHGKIHVLILSESQEKRVRVEEAYIRCLKALEGAAIFTASDLRAWIQEKRIHFVMYHTNLRGCGRAGSYRMEFSMSEASTVDFEIQRVAHGYLPADSIPVMEPVDAILHLGAI